MKEIFKSGELQENSTIRIFRIVQKEGTREVSRELEFYHLDAIITVGYRVNSYQATQFRIWSTNTLSEYITKGFVLNDEMLKNGKAFGKDYFDELLERIREIRASERIFYQIKNERFRYAKRAEAKFTSDYALARKRLNLFECVGYKDL